MPKLKTHRGAAKRFRKTASGRIKCRRSYRSHILTHKSTKQKRRLRVDSVNIKPCDEKVISRMLSGG